MKTFFVLFFLSKHLSPCLLTVPKGVCVHENAEFLVSSCFRHLLKMLKRPGSILDQKCYEKVYPVQQIFQKFSNFCQEFISFRKPKYFLKSFLCRKEIEELHVCHYHRGIWVCWHFKKVSSHLLSAHYCSFKLCFQKLKDI